MKIKKRLKLFVETCMKYLKGLYNLNCIVSGYEIIKSFEKYNAVRTRFTFDIFFWKDNMVKPYCHFAAPWFLKIGWMSNFKGCYGSIMNNMVHSVQMDNMVQ